MTAGPLDFLDGGAIHAGKCRRGVQGKSARAPFETNNSAR
jgi:hypothetical protein